MARAPALHAGGQGFDSLILHGLFLDIFLSNKIIFRDKGRGTLTLTEKTSQREDRVLMYNI